MKSLYLILIHCMCHKILIYKKIQAQSAILLIMYLLYLFKKNLNRYITHTSTGTRNLL